MPSRYSFRHRKIVFFFCNSLYHSFQSVCDERGHINSFGFSTYQKYRFGNSLENWKKFSEQFHAQMFIKDNYGEIVWKSNWRKEKFRGCAAVPDVILSVPEPQVASQCLRWPAVHVDINEESTAEWLAFWRCKIWFSTWMMAVLIEVFFGVLGHVYANVPCALKVAMTSCAHLFFLFFIFFKYIYCMLHY